MSMRSSLRRSQPILGVLAIAVLASACAHDVHARFPAPPDAPTGSITLLFTASSVVSVAINGVLVVHDERTERVVIDDVPTGYAEVSIAAGTGEKQARVWVDSSRMTTVPLGAPEEAPLSAVRGFALSIATVAIYALLR
jgi:hypothetical protein